MGGEFAGAVTAIMIGLGLSAACGFRIFVPLLVASIAAKTGHLQLAAGWDWIGTTPSIVALSIATALEIGAYYIPWLDNLLDAVATPAAVVAGILITASVAGGMSPLLRWSLAVIVGGGAAGFVQVSTTAIRATSTATTAGVANPVVSTAEAGFSVSLSLLAILVPIVAAILVLLMIVLAARFFYRLLFRRRRRAKVVS